MKKLLPFLVLSVLIIGCLSKAERNPNSKDSTSGHETQDFLEVGEEIAVRDDLFRYPVLGSFHENLIDFIPSGWDILDSVSFDFNSDSFLDYLVIIETNEKIAYKKMWSDIEMDMEDRLRILFVLKGKEHGFSLDCQSNELILTADQGGMMGDPYQGIDVSDNRVCISYWGGSRDKWSLSHCFIYRNDHWILEFTETYGGHAELIYNMSYDFATGNFNYKYLEEEYFEDLDSIAVIKDIKYSKVIKMEQAIPMETFRPWTLEIDSVRF